MRPHIYLLGINIDEACDSAALVGAGLVPIMVIRILYSTLCVPFEVRRTDEN